MGINFLKRSQAISLPPFEEVLFWLVNLEGIEGEEVRKSKNFLDQDTLEKAQKFVFEEDRHRSILTHAILRFHMGQIMDIIPHKIKIIRNDLGKSYLRDHFLHFNLSHTKQYAFFGFHRSRPIGVDIEKIQNHCNLLAMSALFMHPIEKKWLFDGKRDRLDAFFSLWCAKEALLKAMGSGFLVKPLPLLKSKPSPFCDTHLFTSMGLDVYVYNRKVNDHKLAVCLEPLSTHGPN